MTPMVDLAFLLLTFFILVSTFSNDSVLQITYPKNGEPTKVANSITLIPSAHDQLYYYRGEINADSGLQKTNYKAVRKMLLSLNKQARQEIRKTRAAFEKKYKAQPGLRETDTLLKWTLNEIRRAPIALYCIIKPDKFAKYKNIIDLVDEMELCEIGKYAITDKFIEPELLILQKEYEKNGNKP